MYPECLDRAAANQSDLFLCTLKPKSKLPPARCLHSAVAHDGKMFVFGGFSKVSEPGRCLNDLWEYDPCTRTWTEWVMPVRVKPRVGHIAAVFDGAMFIFGGYDGNVTLNDVIAFNFEKREFSDPWCWGSLPHSVMQHQGVVVNDHWYIFGGRGAFGTCRIRECHLWYRYSFTTMEWTRAPERSGILPPRRYGHTMVSHRRHIYLHGGSTIDTPHATYLNDTWRYSIEDEWWQQVETSGVPVPPRCCHVSWIAKRTDFQPGDEIMVVTFGRYKRNRALINDVAYVLDLSTFEWSKRFLGGRMRTCRCLTLVSVGPDGPLLMFGGSPPASDFNAVRNDLLHFLTREEICTLPPRKSKAARISARATATAVNGAITSWALAATAAAAVVAAAAAVTAASPLGGHVATSHEPESGPSLILPGNLLCDEMPEDSYKLVESHLETQSKTAASTLAVTVAAAVMLVCSFSPPPSSSPPSHYAVTDDWNVVKQSKESDAAEDDWELWNPPAKRKRPDSPGEVGPHIRAASWESATEAAASVPQSENDGTGQDKIAIDGTEDKDEVAEDEDTEFDDLWDAAVKDELIPFDGDGAG
eukprot:NODE_722_length_1952_cov_22.065160_g668_i0.p1 GENE.NODE_722_length_1952_cov_22.065160_g668_i0~~NODE_722_length_1952_cov_22.065160_g668_i0.p1  ORF type:complete len:587 (-),score=94.85 NODE_722_length_1952_cov_22.065160_g668_i0:86-1846(-)